MNCQFCGSQISGTAFCTQCGAPTSARVASRSAPSGAVPPPIPPLSTRLDPAPPSVEHRVAAPPLPRIPRPGEPCSRIPGPGRKSSSGAGIAVAAVAGLVFVGFFLLTWMGSARLEPTMEVDQSFIGANGGHVDIRDGASRVRRGTSDDSTTQVVGYGVRSFSREPSVHIDSTLSSLIGSVQTPHGAVTWNGSSWVLGDCEQCVSSLSSSKRAAVRAALKLERSRLRMQGQNTFPPIP